MKKNSIFALLAVAVLWSACSNDFDVAAPWKDIPVVYGLINLNDEVHYIRVEKAFLDPDGDALEIAKESDSLYYDNITVQFKVNGETFNLEEVNGTDIDIPRDEGIFAHEPNILYKINKAELGLEEADVVELQIDRGGNLPLVTASTTVQGLGRLRIPDPTSPNPPKLDFTSSAPEQIKWQSSDDARIFDVTLFFNYIEFPSNNPDDSKEKSIEWIWAKNSRVSESQTSYDAERETEEFFEILANNIEADPNMTRFFTDITIRIVSGGEDLEKYVSVVQANTGITGSQEPPTFSNLSEGLGVFSSLNVIEQTGVLLSQLTLEELRTNELTAPLNFQ